MDQAFEQVIFSCAQVRVQSNEGTWIVDDMIQAYIKLHKSGFAHSVEAWQDQILMGGLYGVSLGGCFFGESMFTYTNNASKVAFASLVEHLDQTGFDMIDCQIPTGHLKRFGAKEIARHSFLEKLKDSVRKPTRRGKWQIPA